MAHLRTHLSRDQPLQHSIAEALIRVALQVWCQQKVQQVESEIAKRMRYFLYTIA